MSIPEEALRKTLVEMDSQLQKQKAELSMTDIQLQRKMTNLKINEAVVNELNENAGKPIYRGCGRAFVKTTNDKFVSDIAAENKANQDQINGLQKKKNYLETSLNVTFDNMKKYLGAQQQQ